MRPPSNHFAFDSSYCVRVSIRIKANMYNLHSILCQRCVETCVSLYVKNTNIEMCNYTRIRFKSVEIEIKL